MHNQLQSILLHPETETPALDFAFLSCLIADNQFGNDCVKKEVFAGWNRIP